MPLLTLTCHTPGCVNEGAVIQLDLPELIDDMTGEPIRSAPPVCGPCGQTITDATSAPSAGEQEEEDPTP